MKPKRKTTAHNRWKLKDLASELEMKKIKMEQEVGGLSVSQTQNEASVHAEEGGKRF